jgi:hypothetical protein
MGFAIDRSYQLSFEGQFLDGCEIHIRATSIAAILELEKDTTKRESVAKLLSEHLISWDLEMNGEPIPATYDGILMLEEVVMASITGAWYKAARGVSAPLEKPSTDGEDSEEELIPMEALSPSLAS